MVESDLVGGAIAGGAIAGILGAFFLVFIICALAAYIYSAIAYMTIAKKLKVENGWLAFIPIANIYLLCKMAKVNPLWTLAVLIAWIPVINLAALAGFVYLHYSIFEQRKYNGWLSLLMLVPLANLIILGIVAWKDN
ncbi:MAG TPA: hypothetical protein VK158_04680 [Acidobacteriota bacterium]|nr:hypothetical protein [Acidobacteriota bacterium]